MLFRRDCLEFAARPRPENGGRAARNFGCSRKSIGGRLKISDLYHKLFPFVSLPRHDLTSLVPTSRLSLIHVFFFGRGLQNDH